MNLLGKTSGYSIEKWSNGSSQEQLALSAGVNTSYIGQIERGEKITIKILEQISAALEITLVDLLTLNDPKGGLRSGCHPSALTIITETIKQCLLEVLINNRNMRENIMMNSASEKYTFAKEPILRETYGGL